MIDSHMNFVVMSNTLGDIEVHSHSEPCEDEKEYFFPQFFQTSEQLLVVWMQKKNDFKAAELCWIKATVLMTVNEVLENKILRERGNDG